MPLSPAEQQELDSLRKELKPAPGLMTGAQSNLSPEEAAELAQLRKEVGGAQPQMSLGDQLKAAGQMRNDRMVSDADRANQRQSQTMLESFGNGVSAGYLPQLQAAAEPLMFKGLNAITGQNVQPDNYVDARDANIRRQSANSQEFPMTSAAANIGGAVAAAPLLPLPLPAKLAGAGKGLIGLAKAAGRGAVQGAEYGLIANPGDEAGVVAPVQLGERIGKAEEGAVSGAKWGGGLNLLGKAAGATPDAAKKAMTIFLGPKKETIDYYLKNSKDVNKASSLEELKDKIDTIVTGLRENVNKGQMSVAEAKSGLKEIEQQIASHKRESGYQYQVTKTQVSQALREAKDDFAKALEGETQKLKGVKAPIEMADEVVSAGKQLQDKNVVEGSQNARALLRPEDTVDVQPIYNDTMKIANSMNINGQQPATPEAQAAQQTIINFARQFGGNANKLSPEDAKKVLIQLDKAERASYGPGFTDDVSQAYKRVRAQIDEQLKRNPEYASAMKPVAEAAGLLNAIPRERQEAISVLNRIASPTTTVERENLIKLGKLTGRDFETGIKNYLEAQGKLKDPKFMQQLEESLPQFKSLKTAETASRMLEGPEAPREFMEKRLGESGLLGKRTAAAGLLDKSEQGLLEAEQKASPFKGVTEGSSENKIKGMLKAKPGENIELREQFKQLSALSDTDFEKAINDLRNKESFKKGAMNGSRNVNLFAAGGAMLGGALGGHYGAGMGAATGAGVGAYVDNFGPAVAKRVLDGVLKMGEHPTIQAIKALNVPPAAKEQLVRQLIEFQANQSRDGLMSRPGTEAH